jgi:hypothetical protein
MRWKAHGYWLAEHRLIAYFRIKMNKKSNLLLVLSLCLLLVTQTAHADFRKALNAYIARDGATMLAEVKDAVDKKNDDGIILFLSVLRLDHIVSKSRLFSSPEEWSRAETNQTKTAAPWQSILSADETREFFILLDEACIESSSESKHQFYWLARDAKANVNLDEYTKSQIERYKPSQTFVDLYKAASYLVGNPRQKITKNESRGLQLLKTGLTKPDAYIYLVVIAENVSQYYYNKYKENNRDEFLQESYLWGMLQLKETNSGGKVGIPPIFFQMKKDGKLVKMNPEIAQLIPNSKDYLKYSPDEVKGYEQVIGLLQNTKDIEMPKLVKEHIKNNLNEQPVFTLDQLVTEQYWDKGLNEYGNEAVLNYSLYVYDDGRVNLAIGADRSPRRYIPSNDETLMKLSPAQLKDFLSKVRVGFEDVLLNTSISSPGCINGSNYLQKNILTECMQPKLNGIVHLPVTYLVTMPDAHGFRTVRYFGKRLVLPSGYFAKVLKLVEGNFYLQRYTCGTNKKLAFYDYCIERNKRISKIAS